MNPDWKDYERQIFHLICGEYLDADVSHDIKIPGKKSKRPRQIDVQILQQKDKNILLGIGECRNIKRKIDLTTVDGVIGKMNDVGASFAIIITTQGYTVSAKELADNSNIEIKVIPYEFLKDFGFIPANELDDIFMQEVNYPYEYCNDCDVTNLYEVKVIRGFGEYEWIICPKCKTKLFETRTDGNYRVIKRFLEKKVSSEQIKSVIVDHLLWTRDTWDRACSFETQIFEDFKIIAGKNCEICHKLFSKELPHSFPCNYKSRKICIECKMSERTLLIDYGKI